MRALLLIILCQLAWASSKEGGPVVTRSNLSNFSVARSDPSFKIYSEDELKQINFNELAALTGLDQFIRGRKLKKYWQDYQRFMDGDYLGALNFKPLGPVIQRRISKKFVLEKLFSFKNNRSQKKLRKFYKKSHHQFADLLNMKKDLFSPNINNSMTYINAAHEFSYNPWTKGMANLCSGSTSIHRYFTFLAFYNPSGVRADIKTLYRQIDALLRGNAQIFDGFKSLRDLTSVPEVEEYLKIKTLFRWAYRGLEIRDTLRSLGISQRFKQSKKRINKIIKEIEKRVQRYEYPTVYLSKPQTLSLITPNIHAVLVYKLERLPDGAIKLHYNDTNFYAEEARDIRLAIHVTKERKIYYDSPVSQNRDENNGDIFFTADRAMRMWIPQFNDEEMAEIYQALKTFCTQNSEYCH